MTFFAFAYAPAFNPRFKLALHIIQLVVVAAAIVLTLVRIFMGGQVRSRSGSIALGMGFKSLILIAYQLMAENSRRFRRFLSFKAFLIINLVEAPIWGMVAGLMASSNMAFCGSSVGCGMAWVIVVLAIVNIMLCLYTSVISLREYLDFRRTGLKGKELRSRIKANNGEMPDIFSHTTVTSGQYDLESASDSDKAFVPPRARHQQGGGHSGQRYA